MKPVWLTIALIMLAPCEQVGAAEGFTAVYPDMTLEFWNITLNDVAQTTK